MKKNIFYIICTIVCVFSVAACTADFEYYNTNKHEATEDQMAKDNLRSGSFFRQLQRAVVIFSDGVYADSDYQIAINLLADSYAGYLAPTLSSNGGQHTGSYYMTENWCKALFDMEFTYAMPAWQQMKETAEEAEYQLATVIKVAAMHRVTDYYGPIPYCNFGTDIQNNYDPQEDVYRMFFDELDEAIEYLTEYAMSYSTILTNYDYVYSGNVTNWVKFANSLRLRLAMRVVYVDEDLAKTEAEKSMTNSIGVMTDASEIASLKHSNDLVYHHPIWEINKNFNDGDTQVGASIESFMNGYSDPRMPYYFETASDGAYHGVRNGIHTTTWDNYRNSAGKVSAPAANSSSTEIVWMAPSEVYFLRAEGALRGWNMGDTAKNLYEQGIQMSFTENGAGDASSYIADSSSKPADFTDNTATTSSGGGSSGGRPGGGGSTGGTTSGGNSCSALSTITIAWETDADFETSLERIITQKWIALYPNGPEGWAEFRRTHYPKLLPVVNNDSSGAVDTDLQIRRVPFSVDEYTTNPDGVASGVAALGGADNAGTKLWWDVNY